MNIWVNFSFKPKDPFDPEVENNVYKDKDEDEEQCRECQEEVSNGHSKSLHSKCALVRATSAKAEGNVDISHVQSKIKTQMYCSPTGFHALKMIC